MSNEHFSHQNINMYTPYTIGKSLKHVFMHFHETSKYSAWVEKCFLFFLSEKEKEEGMIQWNKDHDEVSFTHAGSTPSFMLLFSL